MSVFRQCRAFTRSVLVWFVLALGTAAAAPLVQPQNLQLVCSSTGMSMFVSVDQDGNAQVGAGLAQCPLCIVAGAPPPWQPPPRVAPLPPVPPLDITVLERTASRTAPPLPARGPPANSPS